MNYLKTTLLTLALISVPLMAMEQEAPQRANPCTQLKAAFVLGLALFAGQSLPDYKTANAATDPLFVQPTTVGGAHQIVIATTSILPTTKTTSRNSDIFQYARNPLEGLAPIDTSDTI